MSEPAPEYLIDLLITNGCVLAMDEKRTVIPTGAIAIDQGAIVWIGPAAEATAVPATEVLDVHGAILAPGFCDTHFHTGQQLLRGAVPGSDGAAHPKLPLWRHYYLPFEAALREADVYLSARLAYANLLRNGTTCFSDAGGPHPDQMGRAALEIGIRGTVALSTMDRDASMPGTVSSAEAIERNIDLVKRWNGVADGRVRAWLSLRQITACSEELWRSFAEAAPELDCRIHTHLAEGTYEVDYTLERYGLRPVEWLESIGALTPRLHAAHAVLISEEEVRTLGRRDVSVGQCPNGNFRIGVPKTPTLRRAGVRVGLGSDGASRGTVDLLQAARVLRVGLQSALATPWHVESEVSDHEYLRMATLGGAEALGMADQIGSLEVGKRADVVAIEGDFLDALPATNPEFILARCASGHHVRSVVVDGQILIRDGRMTTVDEEALRAEVREASARIAARVAAA